MEGIPSVSSLVSLAFLHSRCRTMTRIAICREYSDDAVLRITMSWTCYSIIYTDIGCIYALSIGSCYILFCYLKNPLKVQAIFAILSFSYNFARFLLSPGSVSLQEQLHNFARFLLSPSSVFLQGQVHLLESVIS